MLNKKNSQSLNASCTLLAGIVLGGWFIETSYAAEFAYGVGYVGEYSDNIQRVPSNPQSEWINSVLAGVAYRNNGPAVVANVLAQAQYRDYKNDIYRDESLYDLDASVLWWISPQRFNWLLLDRYAQLARSISSPDTPDNRIDSNVLSTGPEYLARFGQVNTLVLGGRYGNASYSDATLDNNRYSAYARWQYAANSQMTYSINNEVERVIYDDDQYSDLWRYDLFVRLDMRAARALFQIDLGTTRIDREQTGESDGYLGRLTWTQRLTSGSSAGIALAGEYLDAGTVLLSTVTTPTPGPGDPTASPVASDAINDYFYTKRGELFYSRNDGAFGLNLKTYYRDIEYEVAISQDRRETGARFDVSYSPFSLMAVTLYGNHLNVQYENTDREDRNSEAGARLRHRLSRSLSIIVDARRIWRYSTEASQEYIDNRVLFTFLYASNPLFVPILRTDSYVP